MQNVFKNNLLRLICIFVVFGITIFFSASEILAARPTTAPKIANWNYAWSIDSIAQAEQLALWDVLIIDVENSFYSHEYLERIKKSNPDIKILAYISLLDIRPDAIDLDKGTMRQAIGEYLHSRPEWRVQLSDGQNAEWWPTYHIFNITNAGVDTEGDLFRDFFVNKVTEHIITDSVWDGIFYDNLWEGVSFVSPDIDLDRDGHGDDVEDMNTQWQEGVAITLQSTRARAIENGREDFIITGNGGTHYYEHVDGVGFEHFPDTVYGGWTQSMDEYFFITRHLSRDPYALINTNVQNTQDQTNYKKFRFGLTSTLLGDGYYSFDNGDQTHTEQWYYDEYSVMLGEPLTSAYNTNDLSDDSFSPGVWRRDFEEATVLVNSSDSEQFVDLGTAYEKIQGTQDIEVNSGAIIGSVRIPSHDGIILLRRLSEVNNTTYVNGAYAKIFDMEGNAERNSFFEYANAFAANAQVHRLQKKTIVADNTYIRIYDSSGKLLHAFAPYGQSYSGGIDMAVGKTKKNKIRIVTGNRKGLAQVKIFTGRGIERPRSGCKPFGDFYGGVDVAVGNGNARNRLEILVGAGDGGGPRVRMLNMRCEPIRSSFFAYDSTYRTGVHVALGDIDGDGRDEIITAPGKGGGPQVRIFTRSGKMRNNGFFAYEKSDRGGVWLEATDIDGDGRDEIITNSFSIFNSF